MLQTCVILQPALVLLRVHTSACPCRAVSGRRSTLHLIMAKTKAVVPLDQRHETVTIQCEYCPRPIVLCKYDLKGYDCVQYYCARAQLKWFSKGKAWCKVCCADNGYTEPLTAEQFNEFVFCKHNPHRASALPDSAGPGHQQATISSSSSTFQQAPLSSSSSTSDRAELVVERQTLYNAAASAHNSSQHEDNYIMLQLQLQSQIGELNSAVQAQQDQFNELQTQVVAMQEVVNELQKRLQPQPWQ